MNNLIKIMSACKEFGDVITFIVHPDFIRDGRFYPVIPKTIQMVINEAATRPEKLYFIDQDTSAPVKNTDSEMLVMDVSVFTVGRNLDNLVVMINLGKYWGSGPDDVPRAVIRTLSRPLSAIMFEEIPEPPLDKNEEGYYSFILT